MTQEAAYWGAPAAVRQAVGEAFEPVLAPAPPVEDDDSEEPLELSVDMSRLTINDIDVLEDITGKPLSDMNAEGQKQGPVLRAMAMLAMNRRDPRRFPIGTAADRSSTAEKVGGMRLNLGESAPNPTAPNGS